MVISRVSNSSEYVLLENHHSRLQLYIDLKTTEMSNKQMVLWYRGRTDGKKRTRSLTLRSETKINTPLSQLNLNEISCSALHLNSSPF